MVKHWDSYLSHCISTSNTHNMYLLNHLQSSGGYFPMLSSYDLQHTAYLLGLREAETGSWVSRGLRAINMMTVNMNAAIILKLYSSTMSRTLTMLKHRCNKVGALLVFFRYNSFQMRIIW